MSHPLDALTDWEVIGRGGFATVYRARQESMARHVAVKILNSRDLSMDELRRFRNECQTMGALGAHPNIVSVFDAGTTKDGNPYLVMQYVPEGSLGTGATPPQLDLAVALDLGVQIAGALETAHRSGVLHRDVKPANILRGPAGAYLLSDFGIAALQDGTQTTTGAMVGTVAYLAPEVLNGERSSARSDVYALGTTLHAVISGKPPFGRLTDETPAASMRRVLFGEVTELTEYGVPAAVSDVIHSAMATEPSRRYLSAMEFGGALIDLQRRLGSDASRLTVLDLGPVGPALVGPSGVEASGPPGTDETEGRPEPSSSRSHPSGETDCAGTVIRASRSVEERPGPRRFETTPNPEKGPMSASADVEARRRPHKRALALFGAFAAAAASVGLVAAAMRDSAGVSEDVAVVAVSSTSHDSRSVVAATDVEPSPSTTLALRVGREDDSVPDFSDVVFDAPTDVAVDADGTLFVADRNNNQIRVLRSDGTTVAVGTGEVGDADGPADKAAFSKPEGVAVDDSGTIYVADRGNYQIKLVSTAMVVSRFSGSGSYGDEDGPAMTARLGLPSGIAIGQDGVYVTDAGFHKVRHIQASGMSSTIAGTGYPYALEGLPGSVLDDPSGVAVDPDGNVFVADRDYHRIQKIDPHGRVSVFAGSGSPGHRDGPAVEAQFRQPTGVAVDSIGNVYVSDSGNNRIRMIDPAGNVATMAGSGEAGSVDGDPTVATFDYPAGLTVDQSGTIYVADRNNDRIRVVTADGVVSTFAGR